jgi:hypothetical protein
MVSDSWITEWTAFFKEAKAIFVIIWVSNRGLHVMAYAHCSDNQLQQ